MVCAGIALVGVTGTVRALGTGLPVAQSAFLRFVFGALLLLPVLIPALRGGLRQGALPLYLMRGAIHMGAVLCWFYAMARLPVAMATAIGFLNPVLVTVGAALFLGEKFAMRRVLAIAAAVLGVLIVLRPGVQPLGPGHLAQIGAAFFFAGSYLFAKRLTAIADAGEVVAMLSLTVAVGLAPLAYMVWVPLSWLQAGQLLLVAALSTLGHYCMTRAFGAAPMAVTQPVVFLQLIWATVLGAVAFGEGVDGFVLLGGAVIIAALSYITWREHRIERRAITPAPGATHH